METVKPSSSSNQKKNLRFMLVSTHVQQYTGYSKVSYGILQELSKVPNLDLIHFGFQKHPHVPQGFRPYPSNIDVIDANEGSIITGKEFHQEKLKVNSQERAFIDLTLKVTHLNIRASSGGVIKLTGASESQIVNIDLYGVYNGFGLNVTGNSNVFSGTGAKAEISAGKTLSAKVNFGGSIFYKGSPEVQKNKKVLGGIIQRRK